MAPIPPRPPIVAIRPIVAIPRPARAWCRGQRAPGGRRDEPPLPPSGSRAASRPGRGYPSGSRAASRPGRGPRLELSAAKGRAALPSHSASRARRWRSGHDSSRRGRAAGDSPTDRRLFRSARARKERPPAQPSNWAAPTATRSRIRRGQGMQELSTRIHRTYTASRSITVPLQFPSRSPFCAPILLK